jgi:hypothetical protein
VNVAAIHLTLQEQEDRRISTLIGKIMVEVNRARQSERICRAAAQIYKYELEKLRNEIKDRNANPVPCPVCGHRRAH